MKKLSFLMILCLAAILLLLANCGEPCKVVKPKDLKPIDWENYNDVKTVYWNTVKLYKDMSHKPQTVKIAGYIIYSPINHMPFLCDDTTILQEIKQNNSISRKSIVGIAGISDYPSTDFGDVMRKILDGDLSKKCYIIGTTTLPAIHTGIPCSYTAVYIRTDTNNIYFQ